MSMVDSGCGAPLEIELSGAWILVDGAGVAFRAGCSTVCGVGELVHLKANTATSTASPIAPAAAISRVLPLNARLEMPPATLLPSNTQRNSARETRQQTGALVKKHLNACRAFLLNRRSKRRPSTAAPLAAIGYRSIVTSSKTNSVNKVVKPRANGRRRRERDVRGLWRRRQTLPV